MDIICQPESLVKLGSYQIYLVVTCVIIGGFHPYNVGFLSFSHFPVIKFSLSTCHYGLGEG